MDFLLAHKILQKNPTSTGGIANASKIKWQVMAAAKAEVLLKCSLQEEPAEMLSMPALYQWMLQLMEQNPAPLPVGSWVGSWSLDFLNAS